MGDILGNFFDGYDRVMTNQRYAAEEEERASKRKAAELGAAVDDVTSVHVNPDGTPQTLAQHFNGAGGRKLLNHPDLKALFAEHLPEGVADFDVLSVQDAKSDNPNDPRIVPIIQMKDEDGNPVGPPVAARQGFSTDEKSPLFSLNAAEVIHPAMAVVAQHHPATAMALQQRLEGKALQQMAAHLRTLPEPDRKTQLQLFAKNGLPVDRLAKLLPASTEDLANGGFFKHDPATNETVFTADSGVRDKGLAVAAVRGQYDNAAQQSRKEASLSPDSRRVEQQRVAADANDVVLAEQTKAQGRTEHENRGKQRAEEWVDARYFTDAPDGSPEDARRFDVINRLEHDEEWSNHPSKNAFIAEAAIKRMNQSPANLNKFLQTGDPDHTLSEFRTIYADASPEDRSTLLSLLQSAWMDPRRPKTEQLFARQVSDNLLAPVTAPKAAANTVDKALDRESATGLNIAFDGVNANQIPLRKVAEEFFKGDVVAAQKALDGHNATLLVLDRNGAALRAAYDKNPGNPSEAARGLIGAFPHLGSEQQKAALAQAVNASMSQDPKERQYGLWLGRQIAGMPMAAGGDAEGKGKSNGSLFGVEDSEVKEINNQRGSLANDALKEDPKADVKGMRPYVSADRARATAERTLVDSLGVIPTGEDKDFATRAVLFALRDGDETNPSSLNKVVPYYWFHKMNGTETLPVFPDRSSFAKDIYTPLSTALERMPGTPEQRNKELQRGMLLAGALVASNKMKQAEAGDVIKLLMESPYTPLVRGTATSYADLARQSKGDPGVFAELVYKALNP